MNSRVFFTARIRRMGKAMFSQVSVRSHQGAGGGVSQSKVLSQVSGPRSFPRGVAQSQVLSKISGPRFFEGGTQTCGWVLQSWLGGGLPQSWTEQDCGTAPARTGLGYPPPWSGQDWGTPPTQHRTRVTPPLSKDRRASTCYAAGGMPLAVTQEDFLIYELFLYFMAQNFYRMYTGLCSRYKGNCYL